MIHDQLSSEIINSLRLKEIEINTLFEVTQAINNNFSEDDLYKIFKFTLSANLNIQKIALFALDETWKCKANYGTSEDFSLIPFNETFLQFRSLTLIKDEYTNTPFSEFELLMPVYHKERILANLFLGGIATTKSGTQLSTNFLQALTNIIIVAIENKKLVREQLKQEAVRRDIEIARQLQFSMLPKILPYTDDIQLAAHYLPHDSLGGDYYDFIEVDKDQFLLCIGDVSGKGVPAALLMSNIQASLRIIIRQTTDITKIIHELNLSVVQNSNREKFITLFLALYNTKTKTMNYVNAGHNPPLLLRKDSKKIELLEKGTTILGSFDPLPFVEEGIIENLSHFLLFTYTDGLVEVFNEQNEEFGIERLEDFVLSHKENNLQEMHEKLIHDLSQFKGKEIFPDDITILTCRIK